MIFSKNSKKSNNTSFWTGNKSKWNKYKSQAKRSTSTKRKSTSRSTSFSRSSADTYHAPSAFNPISKLTSTQSPKKVKYKGKKWLLYLTYLASFGLFCTLAGVIGIFVLFATYSRDLPNPNQLLERDTELSTKIFDRNGNSIFEVYGEKNRQLITIDEVSPNIINATLAAEDADFYTHQGYSIRGMVRAARNTFLGEGLQGGSTITQQVVKNALLTQDRTISRKIKELILSLQLESRYSKDQILQMYLNETPYGGQNYGILTAARANFNKHPSELTIEEAAYLAGLPQSPSRYSRFSSDPNAGIERRNYVLYLMYERGWTQEDGKRYFINDEEYEAARASTLTFAEPQASFEAPHFVFYIRELLAEQYGEDVVEQGGLQVTTSLDLETQNLAQQVVKEEVEAATSLNVGNGAMVVIDPQTAQVLAMVGSKDYFSPSLPEGCTSGITGEGSCLFEPALNVTLAQRQPGSSIKPITYAAMLEQGYTASFPFLDVPTTFEKADAGKPYNPVNYDGTFRGVMSLRKSMANSLNITAVKALDIAGLEYMIDLSQRMGVTTFTDPSRYGLSLTLGGGETKLVEMTNAFATFGSGGVYRDLAPILEIKDAKGNIVYNWRDNGGQQAISEEIAFLISDMLSDDGARSAAFGFNSLLNIPGHQVAVKTGTTDDKRDNYFMGYTPNVSVGVWVGNNNNEPMAPFVSSGITGATPIGNSFLTQYLADKESVNFEPPETVKKVLVDELTGALPYGDFSAREEWFIEGTEPTAPSEWYQRLEICEEDGKLASDDCRDADKTEVKDFIKITAELPKWQIFVDRWVGENYNNDSTYFPPETKSQLKFDDDGDVRKDVDPGVSFPGISDGDTVARQFRLRVEVSSPNDIEEVRFYLNGDQVNEDSSEPYGYNFNFSPEQAGEYEFSVSVEDDDGRVGRKSVRLKVV